MNISDRAIKNSLENAIRVSIFGVVLALFSFAYSYTYIELPSPAYDPSSYTARLNNYNMFVGNRWYFLGFGLFLFVNIFYVRRKINKLDNQANTHQ